jgi:hypothetical protein
MRWLGPAAPWISGALLALPLLVFRYPPMADLGMHEALVAVMHHLHDPAWAPPGLYFVVAPQANQLFHLVAYALAFVLPVEAACKVVVIGTVASLPPLLARALARLGRSRWPALLVAPIACGWMFRLGLVANLLGLALLLLALPSLERLARRPSLANAASAAGLACLLVLAHEAAAATFALAAGVFALGRARRAGDFVLRASPAAFVLALVLIQWRVSAGLAGVNMRAIGTDYGPEALERLALLPGALFGGGEAARLGALGLGSALAFAALVIRRGRGERVRLRVALWRHRYALLAAVLALLYLVFPMSLGGTTLVAYRFLPGAWVFAVVASAPRIASRVAVGLAATLALLAVAFEWRDASRADANQRALDAIIAQVPMNTSVAQLDLTPRPAGQVAPVRGETGRVLAERGGRILFAFTDMPPNPVYIPPLLQWNEPLLRLAHAPYALMPAHDLRRFAYLLERNDSPRAAALVEQALAPEAEVVARAGPWTLFHSRLPTILLASPDEMLPSPAPETLVERVNRLADARPP